MISKKLQFKGRKRRDLEIVSNQHSRKNVRIKVRLKQSKLGQVRIETSICPDHQTFMPNRSQKCHKIRFNTRKCRLKENKMAKK